MNNKQDNDIHRQRQQIREIPCEELGSPLQELPRLPEVLDPPMARVLSDDFEIVEKSIAGRPDIVFRFSGRSVKAELGGTKIAGEQYISGTLLQISDESGQIKPEITVHHHAGENEARCVSRIGSALLWSNYAYRMAAASMAAAPTGDDRDLAMPPEELAETLDLSGPGVEEPDEQGGEG